MEEEKLRGILSIFSFSLAKAGRERRMERRHAARSSPVHRCVCCFINLTAFFFISIS